MKKYPQIIILIASLGLAAALPAAAATLPLTHKSAPASAGTASSSIVASVTPAMPTMPQEPKSNVYAGNALPADQTIVLAALAIALGAMGLLVLEERMLLRLVDALLPESLRYQELQGLGSNVPAN